MSGFKCLAVRREMSADTGGGQRHKTEADIGGSPVQVLVPFVAAFTHSRIY